MKIININSGESPRHLLNSKVPLTKDPQVTISEMNPPFRLIFEQNEFYIWRVSKKIREHLPMSIHECWRPESEAKIIESRVIDGIKNKLFPSKKYLFFGRNRPYSMLKELNNIINNEKVLIHLQGFPGGTNSFIINNLDLSKVPVIATSNGGCLRYRSHQTSQFFSNNIFSSLVKLQEQFSFSENLVRNVDLVYVSTQQSYNDFNCLGFTKVKHFKDGISLKNFNNKKKNKRLLRKKLGLPLDCKIILYVGRFIANKGLDILFGLNRKLKKNKKIQLVMIGSDDLKNKYHAKALNEGIVVKGFMEQKELADYYKASDIYLQFAPEKRSRLYGGIGSAVVESLICGTPVIAPYLAHFQGTENERKKLGIQLANQSVANIMVSILKILNNLSEYRECSIIARKYYDLEETTKLRVQDVKKLWSEYYN